ncbi:MAG: hypothetical protein V3S06_07270, partial [candidate division Zixibacteria bacterium]
MIRIIAILPILLWVSAAYGAALKDSRHITTQAPNTQLKVHRASNIHFTITNFGHIGNGHDLMDPDTGELTPCAEFPAHSGLEYLFLGALWIGAEIDTIYQGNPILDTLVSVGADGWLSIASELLPPPEGEESLWEEEIIGDEEFFAVFSDTLTDPRYVSDDPYDGRPHIPLGLKITRNSFCWSATDYDQLFFLNYYLENIGQRYLHNAWIGIYYDGDVWHSSESPQQGAQDDLCGYIQHGDYGIAWIADNDGQPYDGAYDYRSPRNVMGMILIDASEPGVQTNFNWWISNTNPELDWGPQLLENFNGPFPSGGYGTPGPDRTKYFVMSNGEHDYGQIWAALDHTDEGWIPGPPQADDLANGYDTRFLISFGPLDIPAGAAETLTVAYFGGQNLHVDPDNYAQNLRDNTDDSLSIAQYYANLDFSDFLEMADSAISFYEHGFENIPPGPPRNFRISDWDLDHVGLMWDPITPPNLHEYRIYRGTESGNYDPEKITPDNFVDSVFVDSDIVDNTTYYYVIASANANGMEGNYSHEISVNSGQPQTPTGLTATAGNTEVELNWDSNPESDIFGYTIYRSELDEDFLVVDT